MAKLNKSVISIACTLALFAGTLSPSFADPESSDNAGIDVANMDTKAPPGNDFYQYANGTWLKNTPIPNEYDKWGTLNIINDKNLAKLKSIMEKAAANASAEPGSNEQKIGDFYFAGMDEKAIESADLAPLSEELALIEKVKTVEDLRKEVARLHQRGVNVLFNVSSGQDFKNSESMIAQAFQGGL
ncbi:MAG: M13 family metallopeptidase, partial [Cyanobacteria bacterium]|nr:M13 family metallopeptidase [Cyanobacteriota bacterium]